jgi:hypothetical protein
MIRFSEGFASSWKTKNVIFTLTNGTYTGGTPGSDAYTYSSSNPTSYPSDVDQNVPGVAYNSESGFTHPGTVLATNPPLGFQTAGTVNGSQYPFGNGAGNGNTGFNQVGLAGSVPVPPRHHVHQRTEL